MTTMLETEARERLRSLAWIRKRLAWERALRNLETDTPPRAGDAAR